MSRQVVVTGGSSGIGRAVAARFARSGDRVIITGRDTGKLERTAAELGVRGVRCDNSDAADVEELAARVAGEVDVLVNAAGANTDVLRTDHNPPTLKEIADAWRANFDANLFSAVLTTNAFLPRLVEGASVVTVGSGAAEVAATSYGAAKAALAAWTAGVSALVGPRGVTANTAVPGYTEGTDFFPVPLPDHQRTALLAAAHNRRAGTPDDIAGLVFFLAGPDARHITGQAIHVNGGAHITR